MTRENNIEATEEMAVVVAKETAMQVAATPADIINQVTLIQTVMSEVMKKDIHYGVIPGTNGKPTLYKPGAEKLVLTFRLDPQYTWEKEMMENNHRNYEFECVLYHIDSGKRLGSGTGACSTMEKKYRWRNRKHKCPVCGNETIIKGKAEYGGGWLCWKKNDGCGVKFNDGDPQIEGQEVGKVENPDIADAWNTVKKMAKKRAFVDAVLTVTAASDIFTQDVEDMPKEMLNNNAPKKPQQSEYKPKKKKRDTLTFLEATKKMKKRLSKTRGGETGDAIYREVLRSYDAEKPEEILDRESQESFFKDLRVRTEAEEKADDNFDLPIFGADPKDIKSEYKRLKAKQKNKTMPEIDPADVDAFFDACDPQRRIKTDKAFNAYLTIGQLEKAIDWIYTKWEATQ